MNERRPSAEAVQLLKESAATQTVEEILDVCHAFAADPARLAIYLEVLRAQPNPSAQAAASLVCFDLARHGDPIREQDLAVLVPVLEQLAIEETTTPNAALMPPLVAASPYLAALWEELKVSLRGRDPRLAGRLDVGAGGELLEVPLFDAEDEKDIEIDDPDTGLDDDEMEHIWQERFARLVQPGFVAGDQRDLDRLDALRSEALSFARDAPSARDMLPLVELFLAAHLRARNDLGRKNGARDALLESGLAGFARLPEPPRDTVVAWLTEPTATPWAWEKVAELLLDFLAFLGTDARLRGDEADDAAALAQDYARSTRPQPPPARLALFPDRRRR